VADGSFVQAYDDVSRPTSAPPKIFPVAWVPLRPSTSIECPTDVEPDATVMTKRAPGSRVKRRRRRAGLAPTVDANVVDDNVTVCNNTHVDQSIIDLTASGDINIQKAERKYPCHFHGCDKWFRFRQNMSRHMRTVHKVTVRDYKKKFVDERMLVNRIFTPTSDAAENALLVNMIDECLHNYPTYTGFLQSEAEISNPLQAGSVASVVPYAAGNISQLATSIASQINSNSQTWPGTSVTTQLSSASCDVITSPVTTMATKAPVTRGKNLSGMIDAKNASCNWPENVAQVRAADISQILEDMPRSSHVEIVDELASYMPLSSKQIYALRRRIAAAANRERYVLQQILMFLPATNSDEARDKALQDIHSYAKKYLARPPPQAME